MACRAGQSVATLAKSAANGEKPRRLRIINHRIGDAEVSFGGSGVGWCQRGEVESKRVARVLWQFESDDQRPPLSDREVGKSAGDPGHGVVR